MIIVYTSKFQREYKKLPVAVRLKMEKIEPVFRSNPFHPMFETHKLYGRLKEFWSFSIAAKYRVIFQLVGKNTAHFHSVGNHDIYQ